MKIKFISYSIISLALIAAPLFFFLNLFYYIDPINQCFIRIDNKSNMTRDALKYSKKNSEADYKLICRNLSKVVETVCIGADWNLYPGVGGDKPGCYLRGTKIAYLNRMGTTADRAAALAKFAQYSKEYWSKN